MRRGFSLIELLIVIAIILIIITVSIPAYNKAQMFAREMAASKAVQTVQTAQVMYYSEYGHFSPSLRELAPPQTGASSASAAGLISATLASGMAGGYKFGLASTTETYTITAEPAVCGSSGVKAFFLDQNGPLRAVDCPASPSISSPEFAK
jgi:type IV pilus assembly protein PilA